MRWIQISATVAAAGLVWWLEKRRPLRRAVESKVVRTVRNLFIAGLSAGSLQMAERPVTRRLTRAVEARRLGLLKVLKLPRSVEVIAGIVLLDYTLYVWHVMTHKDPFLWRFHRVHHADLDLDASTGIRFHFGEMLISVLYRALQVRVLGIGPQALRLWNIGLLIEVIFHHSNLRLPKRLERMVSTLIVTPRLHGIHHSTRPDEMNSNWSSGLTLWDRLHGTYRDDVPQAEIVIGIPEVQRPEDAKAGQMLAMPFRTSTG